MKITYRFLISLSASIGFTFLLISVLAIVQTVKVHLSGQPKEGFWDTYLNSSNRFDEYAVYFFAAALVFFLLFYVVQVQKKSLRF
jgi:hypothetical protein